MKKCGKCGVEKERREFYANRQNRDGLNGACKACNNERNAANNRKARSTPEGRARDQAAGRKNYYTNRTARLEYNTQYNKTRADPAKLKARWTLNNAVVAGHITKPDTCEHCGTGGRIHGHHTDYTKALEVMWLCPPCHGLEHRKYDLEVIHEHQTNCSSASGCPSLAGG